VGRWDPRSRLYLGQGSRFWSFPRTKLKLHVSSLSRAHGPFVPEVGSSRPPISSLRLCLTGVCSYLMGDHAGTNPCSDPMDWEGAGSDSESPRTVGCMKREGSLIVFLHLTIHVHSNSLDVCSLTHNHNLIESNIHLELGSSFILLPSTVTLRAEINSRALELAARNKHPRCRFVR
jgi:hypothetical protein